MKNMKWTISIAVTVFLLILPCVNAEYVDERESLRDIESMEVSIGILDPEIKKLGLTKEVLRTDIELKLRLAGVKVLSAEEPFKNLGLPSLYLIINTVIINSGVNFAFDVSLYLKQTVDLRLKKDAIARAITWMQSYTGYAGTEVIKEGLRSATKDLVDEFLNDYLAVNPKQPNKPKGRNLLK